MNARGWFTLACAAVSVGCTDRGVGDDGPVGESVSGSTTGDQTSVSVSDTSMSTPPGVTTEPDDPSTSVTTFDPATGSDSGSTGEIDDGCPEAQDGIGAVGGIEMGPNWMPQERSGVAESTCEAVGHDGELLRLQCVETDPTISYTVWIEGGGPQVEPAFEAIVGSQGLQLAVVYGTGFFPGAATPGDFSLRSAEGELLILRAGVDVDVGEPAVTVNVQGWADPFEGLTFIDQGCSPDPNEPDTVPAAFTPLALDVPTDDGLVQVFHGRQETVQRDAGAYEVSVTAAVVCVPDCGPKSGSTDTSFSIVRHL